MTNSFNIVNWIIIGFGIYTGYTIVQNGKLKELYEKLKNKYNDK